MKLLLKELFTALLETTRARIASVALRKISVSHNISADTVSFLELNFRVRIQLYVDQSAPREITALQLIS